MELSPRVRGVQAARKFVRDRQAAKEKAAIRREKKRERPVMNKEILRARELGHKMKGKNLAEGRVTLPFRVKNSLIGQSRSSKPVDEDKLLRIGSEVMEHEALLKGDIPTLCSLNSQGATKDTKMLSDMQNKENTMKNNARISKEMRVGDKKVRGESLLELSIASQLINTKDRKEKGFEKVSIHTSEENDKSKEKDKCGPSSSKMNAYQNGASNMTKKNTSLPLPKANTLENGNPLRVENTRDKIQQKYQEQKKGTQPRKRSIFSPCSSPKGTATDVPMDQDGKISKANKFDKGRLRPCMKKSGNQDQNSQTANDNGPFSMRELVEKLEFSPNQNELGKENCKSTENYNEHDMTNSEESENCKKVRKEEGVEIEISGQSKPSENQSCIRVIIENPGQLLKEKRLDTVLKKIRPSLTRLEKNTIFQLADLEKVDKIYLDMFDGATLPENKRKILCSFSNTDQSKTVEKVEIVDRGKKATNLMYKSEPTVRRKENLSSPSGLQFISRKFNSRTPKRNLDSNCIVKHQYKFGGQRSRVSYARLPNSEDECEEDGKHHLLDNLYHDYLKGIQTQNRLNARIQKLEMQRREFEEKQKYKEVVKAVINELESRGGRGNKSMTELYVDYMKCFDKKAREYDSKHKSHISQRVFEEKNCMTACGNQRKITPEERNILDENGTTENIDELDYMSEQEFKSIFDSPIISRKLKNGNLHQTTRGFQTASQHQHQHGSAINGQGFTRQGQRAPGQQSNIAHDIMKSAKHAGRTEGVNHHSRLLPGQRAEAMKRKVEDNVTSRGVKHIPGVRNVEKYSPVHHHFDQVYKHLPVIPSDQVGRKARVQFATPKKAGRRVPEPILGYKAKQPVHNRIEQSMQNLNSNAMKTSRMQSVQNPIGQSQQSPENRIGPSRQDIGRQPVDQIRNDTTCHPEGSIGRPVKKQPVPQEPLKPQMNSNKNAYPMYRRSEPVKHYVKQTASLHPKIAACLPFGWVAVAGNMIYHQVTGEIRKLPVLAQIDTKNNVVEEGKLGQAPLKKRKTVRIVEPDLHKDDKEYEDDGRDYLRDIVFENC